MIEIERFLLRTNQSKADLLRALGEDPKSSLLSAYASGRSKPSFEMCKKLLLQGMSISELFGDEVDEKIKLLYIETVSSSMSRNPRDVVVNGLKAVLAELEAKTEPLTQPKPNP